MQIDSQPVSEFNIDGKQDDYDLPMSIRHVDCVSGVESIWTFKNFWITVAFVVVCSVGDMVR